MQQVKPSALGDRGYCQSTGEFYGAGNVNAGSRPGDDRRRRRSAAIYIGMLGAFYAITVYTAAGIDMNIAAAFALMGCAAVGIYGAIIRAALLQMPWWLK